jgi:hypothetical protein
LEENFFHAPAPDLGRGEGRILDLYLRVFLSWEREKRKAYNLYTEES